MTNIKNKKAIAILKNFYNKIAEIETAKKKLVKTIRDEEEQAKIKQTQDKLKNL